VLVGVVVGRWYLVREQEQVIVMGEGLGVGWLSEVREVGWGGVIIIIIIMIIIRGGG
jgi:hypothetical protein